MKGNYHITSQSLFKICLFISNDLFVDPQKDFLSWKGPSSHLNRLVWYTCNYSPSLQRLPELHEEESKNDYILEMHYYNFKLFKIIAIFKLYFQSLLYTNFKLNQPNKMRREDALNWGRPFIQDFLSHFPFPTSKNIFPELIYLFIIPGLQ